MKSFSNYAKNYKGGRRRTKRRTRRPRPVSLKSARNILRKYYIKTNRRNRKKATRALRRDMATKSPHRRVLRSNSSRSHLYRPRRVKRKTGPKHFDMHGLDNKHRNFRAKKSYRRYRKYSKKRGQRYGRPKKPTGVLGFLNELFRF